MRQVGPNQTSEKAQSGAKSDKHTHASERADTRYEFARCALLSEKPSAAEREWSACLSIEPLPFLVIAAAEKEVTLPSGPIDDLRAKALDTQERLRQLAAELDAMAQKLNVERVRSDSVAAGTKHGAIDAIRVNRVVHKHLVQTVERLSASAETHLSELHREAADLSIGAEASWSDERTRRRHRGWWLGGMIGRYIATKSVEREETVAKRDLAHRHRMATAAIRTFTDNVAGPLARMRDELDRLASTNTIGPEIPLREAS